LKVSCIGTWVALPQHKYIPSTHCALMIEETFGRLRQGLGIAVLYRGRQFCLVNFCNTGIRSQCRKV